MRAIAAYVPGKPIAETARELGIPAADILKMASNENPLGPSPRAVEAMRGALGELHYYPDGSGYDLKAVIAGKLGVEPGMLVLGNGSNDVLELAARAFLQPGDSAVFSRHAFLVYPLVTQAIGAVPLEVPAKDYGADLDAMLKALRAGTRRWCSSPTRTTRPAPSSRGRTSAASWSACRRGCWWCWTRPTASTCPPELASPTAAWVERIPNLVVSRTLSKAYGLAGLRVGFGIADARVAEVMNRVRQPFNVNHLAMVAAVAALGDEAFIAKSRSVNAAGLVQLVRGFEKLGLEYIPSRGNFITVRVGDAKRVYEALLKDGVIVRPIAGYGLPEHLRVTVGLPEHNARFLASLGRALGRA